MKIETLMLGYVEQRPVRVAHMPRDVWISMVKKRIGIYRDDYGVDLTDQLMPVAETMDRFPLGEWIHNTRGCGCLVGEYLVAHDIINRADFAGTNRKEINVSVELEHEPNAERLEMFGNSIDLDVRGWINLEVGYDQGVEAVVFD